MKARPVRFWSKRSWKPCQVFVKKRTWGLTTAKEKCALVFVVAVMEHAKETLAVLWCMNLMRHGEWLFSFAALFEKNSFVRYLMHLRYLNGIVSSGYGCAFDGYPTIYTRVTYYLPWIHNIIDNWSGRRLFHKNYPLLLTCILFSTSQSYNHIFLSLSFHSRTIDIKIESIMSHVLITYRHVSIKCRNSLIQEIDGLQFIAAYPLPVAVLKSPLRSRKSSYNLLATVKNSEPEPDLFLDVFSNLSISR